MRTTARPLSTAMNLRHRSRTNKTTRLQDRGANKNSSNDATLRPTGACSMLLKAERSGDGLAGPFFSPPAIIIARAAPLNKTTRFDRATAKVRNYAHNKTITNTAEKPENAMFIPGKGMDILVTQNPFDLESLRRLDFRSSRWRLCLGLRKQCEQKRN